jgi:hypothetical protein
MGGSGGGGYFRSDPQKVKRELAAQNRTLNEVFEAYSNNVLQDLLGAINNRDPDLVSRRLDEVKRILEDELDGTLDLRFGGSVAKHTYVDGLSDVDSLVLLDSCELAEQSPAEAKAYLAKRLSEDLHTADVSEGKLAVTAKFPDLELQLLPAVSCKGAVQIGDPVTGDWARIKPREFARVLTEVNERNARKVVPVIKLAKAIIANLPERTQISGYHAESLAVKIFRDYEGPLRHKDMLHVFFQRGAVEVRTPIKDRSGQSVNVDEYLGREGSLERRIVSDYFARISRKMTMADQGQSIDQWKSLFGDEF